MCTVTWANHPSGYTLCFNRDEQRTRSIALPAALREQDGTRYLAPQDPDGGGSWIGANEYGLAVCLLNGYRDTDRPASHPPTGDQWHSRGQLVTRLSGCPDLTAVAQQMTDGDWSHFRSFVVLAMMPDAAPVCFRWDGQQLQQEVVTEPMLTSSSVDSQQVIAGRQAVYRHQTSQHQTGQTPTNQQAAARPLRELHRSHLPERGPGSICMHRSDAHTVSYTEVEAGPRQVTMRYQTGAPCQQQPMQTLHLAVKGA